MSLELFTNDPPHSPGTYLLHFDVRHSLTLVAGRLGRHVLTPGQYVYVGSALGPGGLRARLQHHQSGPRRHHWHIDYLTTICPPQAITFAVSQERLECRWVQALCRAGASCPILGFGSSDCRQGCGAHLLLLPHEPPGSAAFRHQSGSGSAGWTVQALEELLR